jgi:endonuclease YncB( thermonuclease family)
VLSMRLAVAIFSISLASSLCLTSSHSGAGEISGPVVSVLDGDTIEVLHNSHPERIRHNSVAYPYTVFHAEALRLLQNAKVSRSKIVAAPCCE